MSPETLDNVKQIAGALAIGLFQGYNIWRQHKQKQAIAETKQLLTISYGDVKADLDAMHASLEKLEVKLIGGDRRKPESALAPAKTEQPFWRRRRWRELTGQQ